MVKVFSYLPSHDHCFALESHTKAMTEAKQTSELKRYVLNSFSLVPTTTGIFFLLKKRTKKEQCPGDSFGGQIITVYTLMSTNANNKNFP